MKSPVLIMALVLALGIALGLLVKDVFTSTDSQPTALSSNAVVEDSNAKPALPAANAGTADIEQLNQMLREEIRARQALQKKLDNLSEQVVALSEALIPSESLIDKDDTTGEPNTSDSASEDWLDEQALLNSGLSLTEVTELKTNFEQLELERLYLRDQSIRESWDRDQFREAMRDVASRENDLREQMSESTYDAYLYASGQPNRVSVSSVLASAQAANAGVQAGDQIVSYDNQRIYNAFELREATTSGSIGDTVSLEVERDGSTIQLFLPRGPLGIRMNSLSVEP